MNKKFLASRTFILSLRQNTVVIMKKLIIALCAVFALQLTAFGQTEKEVKPVLENYTQDLIEGNWVKSLDYTYPGLFSIVPKAQMEAAIEQTFSDTSMFVIGFNSMEYGSISKLFKEADYSYSFVKYTMEMTMKFSSGIPAENHQATADMMKMQFGDENVTLVDDTMIIKQNNTMAAIKKSGEDTIYFMEIKDQLFSIMDQFMSEEFMANAKAQM